ncbi:MAS protein, partial [Eurystomus gularis]|nr:MAS protein [Eurystomus gularis]
ETMTTDPFLSSRTYGPVNAGESIEYDDCPSPPVEGMVFAGVCMGICLWGLVGNGMVLWFLGFQMKKNPFTIYVLNLAITDFSLLLSLLVKLPLFVISTVYCIFSDEMWLPSCILLVLICFCYFTSMYLLTAISVERCLSVL